MDQLDFSFIILSFSSLFALLNPIGIAPIILSLTENYNLDEYKKLIRKSSFFACMILLIFAFMGKIIFSFYSITIHAFKIAGGILFLRIGLNMLEAKVSRTKSTPKESEEAESNTDIALSPIGIPLIAGPGAITSIMILSSQTSSYIDKCIVHINILITLIITYIILLLGKKISKKIGTTGIRIIQRIMGLILLVISIQFIINGILLLMESQSKL